jgi:predicted ATP-grasp superfamily ATP-dependent carboligase
MKRVLIFPCGTEIGLEINRALASSIHFEMYGASSLADHGRFVYKNYIEGIPFADDENFISEIEKICKNYNIDFIVPAHDSVVLALAKNQEKLSAKVLTSPLETCEIARSKSKTYQVLKSIIQCPKTYDVKDPKICFPVFVKPDVGQGSKGAHKIHNREELINAYNQNNKIIISEYLPGSEYTIDCFSNRHGDLLFAKGRTRSRINNGISVNSQPIDNPNFMQIAHKINSCLKFQGMWFFQLKEDFNKNLVLLEIAPRIAGTMSLYRGLGINFIQLALYDAMGEDVEIFSNNFEIEIDRALFARYKTNINYETVYVDFDDTILLNDTVNTDMMKFLYQAKNEKKDIVLITKHAHNLDLTLSNYCIDKNLFTKIIHIGKTEDKTNYIKKSDALFIDDSFSERIKVSKNCKIPVFGIDAIEVLLNYEK